MEKLDSLSNSDLINLKQDIQVEINKRKREYIQRHAKNATINAEKVKDIVDSVQSFYRLPLPDFAKVELVLNEENKRLRSLPGCVVRFWPTVKPLNPDEEYNILWDNKH